MNLQQEDNFLDKYTEQAASAGKIKPDYYTQYNVKRGLRNADGTGVLVGLTDIGDVHGYILDEGEKVPVHGRLRYRGYDVADMVKGFQKEKRFGYEETIFLILFGRLPLKAELDDFNQVLGAQRFLPKSFPEDMILNTPSANIMNKLSRSVLAFYSFDENPEDNSIRNVLRQTIDLTAKFPSITAYCYQAKRHYFDKASLFIHAPQPELSTAENLLVMVRQDSSYTRLEAELLDLNLVLHAEHGGGNNSTFTVHVVSSSSTDTYAAIAAAIGSLKGTSHGGANTKVVEMMGNIKENVKDWKDKEEVSAYLRKILNKEANDKTGLIYGMGHAVYTLSDPRAVLLKEKALELADFKKRKEEFELYLLVEEMAPNLINGSKNKEKVVAANVDFFSGFVYDMLNIPMDLYTPIFAMSRIPAWGAHRIEEILSSGRIMRPAFKNISSKNNYIPLSERE